MISFKGIKSFLKSKKNLNMISFKGIKSSFKSKKNLIKKIEEKKSLLAKDLGILNDYIEKEEFKNIDAHKDMEDLEELFMQASGISESFKTINLINHELKTLKDWKNTLDYSISQIKESVRILVFTKLDKSYDELREIQNYVSDIEEKNFEYNKNDIFQPKKEVYGKIIYSDFKKIDNFKTKLRNAVNLKEVLEIDEKIDKFNSKPITIDDIKERRDEHEINQGLKKLKGVPIEKINQAAKSLAESLKDEPQRNTNLDTQKTKSTKTYDAPKPPTISTFLKAEGLINKPRKK